MCLLHGACSAPTLVASAQQKSQSKLHLNSPRVSRGNMRPESVGQQSPKGSLGLGCSIVLRVGMFTTRSECIDQSVPILVGHEQWSVVCSLFES